ncbi:hypothetical protein GCM10011351_29300 [Paraliobacillus quinghaiensis]|uniref:Uncharacterized protein n=1 Tax=Paraliobacillus quinghaiensis TaxID=470815 RepID=A0A917WY96_9BACI|nr:hypothetical protein [Paraliobacillus quinghaiensis]GGM41250.1 hypothetical protein GCM10011351_29300 [Paraliobacillus quinghaiensis]
MLLPSIDVGLMNEHLAAHKGILHKLKKYYAEVGDPYLKQMIYAQIIIMESHVVIMLNLLEPNNNQWLQVVPLQEVLQQVNVSQINPKKMESDKLIALEVHSTSKFLANDNFLSGLMMKNDNVKQVHFDMAYQQASFEKMYGDYLEKMGWSLIPKVTVEEQLKVINHYKGMFYKWS